MLQVTIFLTVLQLHGSLAIPAPSEYLEVYALPVGQGDCTIIQCPAPGGQLIINDCGSSGGNGWNPRAVQMFLRDRQDDIEAIFISHADRDHYNYLPRIITSNNIQSVIIGGMVNDYPKETRDWLNAFGPRLRLVNNGAGCIGTPNCAVPEGTDFCDNPDIHFNILAANVGITSNEKSIVLKVVHSLHLFSILLPGDMEGNAGIEIATTLKARLGAFVYKMAHHGASDRANQQEWLNWIQPTQAFASSAYNFGNCRHPRCDTVLRIQNMNTIAAAPPHQFYCGNAEGGPTNLASYDLHIYETSPTGTMTCLLRYTSNLDFNQECLPGGEPLDNDGDEC